MSNGNNSIEVQQALQRLVRMGSEDSREVSVVTSPGTRAASWSVKIKSLSSYNVYNVKVVEIGDPGSLPIEIGGEMQAVNLAESFLQSGSLPAGTYAVMSRAVNKNVFYVPV